MGTCQTRSATGAPTGKHPSSTANPSIPDITVDALEEELFGPDDGALHPTGSSPAGLTVRPSPPPAIAYLPSASKAAAAAVEADLRTESELFGDDDDEPARGGARGASTGAARARAASYVPQPPRRPPSADATSDDGVLSYFSRMLLGDSGTRGGEKGGGGGGVGSGRSREAPAPERDRSASSDARLASLLKRHSQL